MFQRTSSETQGMLPVIRIQRKTSKTNSRRSHSISQSTKISTTMSSTSKLTKKKKKNSNASKKKSLKKPWTKTGARKLNRKKENWPNSQVKSTNQVQVIKVPIIRIVMKIKNITCFIIIKRSRRPSESKNRMFSKCSFQNKNKISKMWR